MFGILKKKTPRVLDHWYVLLPDFRSSTADCYENVQERLTSMEVPGLDVSEMNLTEGGFAAGKRRYLRMKRERLVFDVCSTSFGTSWFFSCRAAEIPFKIRIWELIVLLILANFGYALFPLFFGDWGVYIFALTVIGFLYTIHTLTLDTTHDVDSILLRIPILGALYELFLRRNATYYREDSRLMYLATVGGIVREEVRAMVEAQGIEDVEFVENPMPVQPTGLLGQIYEIIRATFVGQSK